MFKLSGETDVRNLKGVESEQHLMSITVNKILIDLFNCMTFIIRLIGLICK